MAEEKTTDKAPDAGTQKVEQPAKVEPSAEKKEGGLPEKDFFNDENWNKANRQHVLPYRV